MESNGNQRKRGGRNVKNANANEKSSQNSENNEVMEVSAVAMSPTLEESETVNNAPASECRRSSRKKIIKFDVRDLLNKHRKTHKIQIEARIDSNAPTTSKAATTGGVATASSQTSTMTSREDLLSKHKTFLEKSAIFRRYSVSQEHKAPPPPLPIPPLLGKGNDHKDSNFSGTSSCQEFLSHAMIKPKEPTSLIVAQIESNKPSTVVTTKRKNMYKALAMENKVLTSCETAPAVQPKKRGRPAKVKTPAVENLVLAAQQDEKKITPEKATNWKEYKACVAQQSSSSQEENKVTKKVDKAIIISKHRKDVAQILFKKHDEIKNIEDTLQSDISRSDDDGNFSGFQSSKDDLSCDSPVLENMFLERNIAIKDAFNSPKKDRTIFKAAENKSPCKSNQIIINEDNATRDEKESYSTRPVATSSEINPIPDSLYKPELNICKNKKDHFEKVEIKIPNETKILEENLNIERPELNIEFVCQKVNKNIADSAQKQPIETRIEKDASKSEISSRAENPPHQYKDAVKSDECQAIAKLRETEIISSTTCKQEMQVTPSNTETIENKKVEQIQNKVKKALLESEKISEKCEYEIINTSSESFLNAERFEALPEIPKELKVINIGAQTSQTVAECTTPKKVAKTDISVLKSQTILSHPSSSSDETKSFSRTSSSSESENVSERSFYSSETFSSASSSSPRSYKSGDKLKVSVKRMLLPKSPSTSSQTSTSEEFNQADVIRRKPPIAKRSKRLQKKFREALDAEGVTENINDGFQKTSSEDKKLELNIKPINIQDITTSVCDNKTEVERKNELDKKMITKTIIKSTTQCSTESFMASEITDTLSNESSDSKDKSVERKSLRNRKDNISCENVVGTDKAKFKEKEILLEKNVETEEQSAFTIEHLQQQKMLSNQSEDDTNKEKKTITDVGSSKSDKLKNNEQIKELDGKLLITTESHEKKVITPSMINEQTNTEAEDIITDKVVQSTKIENKEDNIFKLSTLAQKTDTCENVNDIVTCKKTTQATIQYKSGQNVEPIFEKVEQENTAKIATTDRSADQETEMTLTTVETKEKTISKSEENLAKCEPKMSKMNSKPQMSPKTEIDKQNKTDVVLQVKTVETNHSKKKLSRTDKEEVDKIASSKYKTNEEETLAKNLVIRGDQNIGDEVKSTKFSEQHEQSLRKNAAREDQPNSEIIQAATYGKAYAIDKEAENVTRGKNSKIVSPKNKLVKEIALPEDVQILKENYGNLQEMSTNPTKEVIVDAKKSSTTLDETKTFSEKSRSSSNKKEISSKESSHEASHDAIQLEVCIKGSKITPSRTEVVKEIAVKEDNDGNLQETSTHPKKEATVDLKKSSTTHDEAKTFSKKSNLIIENIGSAKPEKVIATRSSGNKKDISEKESTHDAIQLEVCTKESKVTPSRTGVVKEIAFKEDNDGNLKKIYTDPEKETAINVKQYCTPQDKAKTFSETSNLIIDNVSSAKPENVIASRRSGNKKEISTKESSREAICKTHDAIKLGVCTKDSKITPSRTKVAKEIAAKEDSEILKEDDGNLRKNSTDPKKESTSLKLMEKPDLITEKVISAKPEKVIATRSSGSKKEIPAKDTSHETICTTHDAIQLEVCIEDSKITPNKTEELIKEDSDILKENYGNLKEISTDQKKEETIIVKKSSTAKDEANNFSEKSNLITENIGKAKVEDVKATRSSVIKKEISAKKSNLEALNTTHDPIQLEVGTKEEFKKVDSALTIDLRKNLKEEFAFSSGISANLEDKKTQQSHPKESEQQANICSDKSVLSASPVTRKKGVSKKTILSPTLSTSSSENSQTCSPASSTKGIAKRLEDNAEPLPDVKLQLDPVKAKQSPAQLTLTSSSAKTCALKQADLDKPCQQVDLVEKATSSSNAQQETPLQGNNEQSEIVPIVTKRRVRKSRFKNLHGPEIDSETDSSNGKSTSMDAVNLRKQETDTEKITTKEQVEDKEIKTMQTSTTAEGTLPNEIDVRDETVSLQENAKGNLLRSQIKNVSIETNTLLDILRTVQSNTAAALKANKSPINIDRMNKEEPETESCSKIDFDEKPQQQQSKTLSPILFNTDPSLTVKKQNLSPARSDSGSPLTLKKVTPSPTRSSSSSPLTLKKVTRRYERRSRRGEESAHKTLEETFAEIAAQSSKAVLAAKEFDSNEEQTKNDKSQKELEIFKTSSTNFEKEDFKENLVGEEKTLPLNNEKQVVESVLHAADELGPSPDVSQNINSMENVVEVETTKVTPGRKGRKQKNPPLDLPMAETKEIIEVDNSTVNKESSAKVMEIVKEHDIQSKTEVITEAKLDENKSSEIALIEDLPGAKNENSLSLSLSQPQDYDKHSSILPETAADEESLKELDISECELSKQIKKPEAKEFSEDDALRSPTDTPPDKEEESCVLKLQMKKRDSSLSKSETKSVCKKTHKKIKNDEDDSLSLQKETLVKIGATTPPPSKRGRKPKNQQQPETPQTSSKKKNKKDVCSKTDEDISVEKPKALDSESESLNSSTEKSLDEKMAKKKRQKKLKEAFEAALIDDKEKFKENSQTDMCDTPTPSSFGLTLFSNSPPPDQSHSISNEEVNETIKFTSVTPVDTEDDLDPLKDIEKFIADGVNLLKKDYKLDEDSVDDVMQTTPPTTITKTVDEPIKTTNEETKHIIFNTFETPADTPINTPSATPPPKSPTSAESSTPDETSGGVRRSHRIKLITKTPKALVGRGLVRDRERFSIKDDVETKSHYSMDDHLTDLAEVEAKNAKFLKEMEERLSNFQVIKENDYLCERVVSREAKKMICDCFLTHEEEGRGELGCGEDCLNRLLMIECGPECNVKERCTNKRFQKLLCSPCRVFRTEKKGFGIMADIEILPGEFIMEYIGEVIDTDEFEKRRHLYSQDKNRHYYFMALRSDAIIDATIKGNISRFINHSCDPNAETQKWTVNGELRIGFFSRKSIMPGEEITFNYQYQRYGREAQRCYCESGNCTGWIGQEPTSDEGEQLDDEYDESEDEEEADTSNLLVQDDDEDSDASVADPEEVQKQLEMAAAQAEVDLAPLQLLQDKVKQAEATLSDGKSLQDLSKTDNEEDSKSKFKKLLSKMAEKVAAKQKENKREQKLRRKKKSKESSAELANKLRFLEDPDIEDEVEFLKECGLKNQSDTLRLSRLMVRAKLVQTRLNLLEILRKGDFPCRRLFLDYHGLRLLHGWMSEDAGNMQIRMSLLQTLETLPIANKTVLTDSKVMHVVRTWGGTSTNLSPNEDSSNSSNSNSQEAPVQNPTTFEEGTEMAELQKLALKLITTWEGLPEIFRIPKKERLEQMKEHEREADRQYAANAETQEINTATDRFRRDRFGRGLNTASSSTSSSSNRFFKPNNGNPHKTANAKPENLKNLSKAQRREMFAAKVARDEAEKRLAEERREFETKCRFFGLDPKKTRAQDIPFCVNPATGQWFSVERKPIATPPSYAHVQVPVKPKSTDPKDYQLPAVCSSLPSQWKYAITAQGKIYYYHIKHRIAQWEPPSPSQQQQCELEAWEDDSESEITTTAGEDSSDDDDDILIGMDTAQLKAYIDRKVEMRRQKRYQRLVDQRSISPRREEDRIYNQLEVRKYKENKEKIRKRKEDIRRRRTEALRQTSLNMCTLGSITDTNPNTNKSDTENNEELGILPIQDYLLSSDEEIDLKAEVNSPLIDKIVEGDKIVDELDALTTKRQLKRPLPPHRDFNEPSTSASTSVSSTTIAKQEYKKRKLERKEKRKPKEQDAKYRKNKEKFRCEIAGIIVHHLKPYLKETCTLGRIQSNEDFNHLARKLTHFVMIKELKYCESVGQTLVVTDSVKSKSREFIKKYMAKYGGVYIKPTNDPNFKDIPFTL